MSKKISFSSHLNILLLFSLIFTSCKTHSKFASEKTAKGKKTEIPKNSTLPNPAETLVVMSTDSGDIKIRLFNETPLHRDNFIKLVEQGFYDSLLFHRVINNFMIQGGDPDSKRAKPDQMLGDGDIGYTIPAEFNPKLFHKKGALCAARQGDDVNPQKASSGCQFYIVQGKKLSENDLLQFEYRINRPLLNKITEQVLNKPENSQMKNDIARFKQQNMRDSLMIAGKKLDELVKAEYKNTPHYEFSPEQKAAYAGVGGTPHLDGSYTVFGEVYEGLEIIDKIGAVPTSRNDRPLKDLRIKKVKIIHYKK